MNHTIENAFLKVTAAEHGAELQSILGADGTEYLWQGDPAYWADRALNIFPYVARLTGGEYSLDGEKYAMPIHGLAPTADFALEENTGEKMVFRLESSDATRSSYPREFVFRVVYALRENTLEVTFQVENRDEKTMYFGIGGHPGFNVPMEKGKKFEDYRLRFLQPCQPRRVGFTADCFRDGTTTPYQLGSDNAIALRHDLFDEDAIVLQDMAKAVRLESGDGHSVTVSYPGMDYLGIWHWPRTDAPYVCIEPWCSLPATQGQFTVFEEQKDLIRLEAGKTYRNTWTITVE